MKLTSMEKILARKCNTKPKNADKKFQRETYEFLDVSRRPRRLSESGCCAFVSAVDCGVGMPGQLPGRLLGGGGYGRQKAEGREETPHPTTPHHTPRSKEPKKRSRRSRSGNSRYAASFPHTNAKRAWGHSGLRARYSHTAVDFWTRQTDPAADKSFVYETWICFPAKIGALCI